MEGIPECGGEKCLIALKALGGVAALNTKMSLRIVFTPGLKRTLLFLPRSPQQRPEKTFPSVLSRGLTLAAQKSRSGTPMPLHPSPDVPQSLVKTGSRALGSLTSLTFPAVYPFPIFVGDSCSIALVRRPGSIHLDPHTDLGAYWSS